MLRRQAASTGVGALGPGGDAPQLYTLRVSWGADMTATLMHDNALTKAPFRVS